VVHRRFAPVPEGPAVGLLAAAGYAITQALFDIDGEVILAFAGYGLPYHLSHTADLIVWLTFVVGDLNFIAAVAVVVYLLRRRDAQPETTGRDSLGGRHSATVVPRTRPGRWCASSTNARSGLAAGSRLSVVPVGIAVL
jgi:hypothetical protein